MQERHSVRGVLAAAACLFLLLLLRTQMQTTQPTPRYCTNRGCYTAGGAGQQGGCWTSRRSASLQHPLCSAACSTPLLDVPLVHKDLGCSVRWGATAGDQRRRRRAYTVLQGCCKSEVCDFYGGRLRGVRHEHVFGLWAKPHRTTPDHTTTTPHHTTSHARQGSRSRFG
jgi:hypothetical protein